MLAPQTLIPRDAIATRVGELGQQIRAHHGAEESILCIGVLTGAFVFMADLVRAIPGPVECDFLMASSYAGTASTGEVTTHLHPRAPLRDRSIVLVEDIVDTGRTVATVRASLLSAQPRSLTVACLLDKPSRREVTVPVDWVGFEIEDRFVVGYGLDLDGRYRSLPDVAVLD